jgi:hypothetical protein
MESVVRHRFQYVRESGPIDRVEALTDLLADLRHAFTPDEFVRALHVSADHFKAETDPEGV